MSKRIVVTGMGALTPLGSSVESTWQRLLDGQSGIRRVCCKTPKPVLILIDCWRPRNSARWTALSCSPWRRRMKP